MLLILERFFRVLFILEKGVSVIQYLILQTEFSTRWRFYVFVLDE